MKIEYLIVSIAIMLALIITGPVSAYSLSVSAINDDRDSSRTIQSYPGRVTTARFLPRGDTGITTGSNSNGSSGSVNAFSKGTYQDQSTFVEFRNSVTVSGVINKFDYTARYDSGIFR